jgi:hypothetical protein
MSRIYFYVVDVGGEWEVATRDDRRWAAPLRFRSRDDAIRCATRIARAEWSTSDCPTGVRVATTLGDWADERTFGRDPPEVRSLDERRGL